MAFSDFKAIPDVQKKFGIRHIENDFIICLFLINLLKNDNMLPR